MKNHLLRPHSFAIGLLAIGFLMLFVPMMVMPGVVAVLAAIGYWLCMIVVKFVRRPRN